MTATNRLANAETADPHWNWLYTVGGAAALIIFGLLLIGTTGISSVGSQSPTTTGWVTSLQNNWLVVLFKLNAGFSGVQPNLLNVLNLLDIAIMLLSARCFSPSTLHSGILAKCGRSSPHACPSWE